MITSAVIWNIAVLIGIAGLAVEIAVASRNIFRAQKYLRQERAAMRTAERLSRRLECSDEYASKLLWLLRFLYERYDGFADLEKELDEGSQAGISIGEADDYYKSVKAALHILDTAVKVSEFKK
jgi:hypothetical protein